jgi:hypothetical protein
VAWGVYPVRTLVPYRRIRHRDIEVAAILDRLQEAFGLEIRKTGRERLLESFCR